MEEIGVITAIERQKRNRGRVSVHVDGAYLGSVEDIVWVRSGLKVGDALMKDLWEDMLLRQEAQAALDRALLRLASRARASAEMERHLREKGFSHEAVRYAVEKLRSYGYLDDGEFARMYVRDRMNLRPEGRRALAGGLKRLGVAGEDAEPALAQVSEEDELQSAVQQAEKAARRTAGEGDQKKRRAKVYASLARRGYPHDVIEKALSGLFEDRNNFQ